MTDAHGIKVTRSSYFRPSLVLNGVEISWTIAGPERMVEVKNSQGKTVVMSQVKAAAHHEALKGMGAKFAEVKAA